MCSPVTDCLQGDEVLVHKTVYSFSLGGDNDGAMGTVRLAFARILAVTSTWAVIMKLPPILE